MCVFDLLESSLMFRIEFAEGFEQFFAENGMRSFDEFFELKLGDVINRNTKRNVVAFSVESDGGVKEFFMKRFIKPHYKDMWFTFRNFGRICSQGGCEWRNANLLLDNGVETYRPVCYGEEMVCGIEKRSFFITEKLGGECLTDFVGEKWAGLDEGEKDKIMSSLAKVVRRVHDAGVSMPDLYVWHVFVSKGADGEYEFAIIDLHRMKLRVKSKSEFARNLGAFDFSMLGKYFDDRIRRVFIRAYIEAGDHMNEDALWSKMRSRSRVLSGRRRSPGY